MDPVELNFFKSDRSPQRIRIMVPWSAIFAHSCLASGCRDHWLPEVKDNFRRGFFQPVEPNASPPLVIPPKSPQ
jgi:hypothetical protein